MRAGQGSSEERHAALDTLCHSYWYPLYAFLRRGGMPPPDAEDCVQGFFARLLDGRLLDAATPARGRFRTLLLGALKNFVTDEHRAATAAKRGSGQALVPLEIALAEERWQADASAMASPELAYDRAWAAVTLAAAGTRLRAEFAKADRLALFEAVFPRVTGAGRESNEMIGRRLGMTPGAVAAAATRMRDRYAEAIREEIALAVETDAEINDELRHLLGLFT